MTKLLVAADDFTGALDTGVQLAKHGIPTLVAIYDYLDYNMLDDEIHVLVVDTESRHISSGEAEERVYEAAVKAKAAGFEYFYKKTDSTLRGNIGSELKALLDASGATCLVFIPAFPQAGRTTLNGIQYVYGVPVHKTAFAFDSQNPVKDSFIPDIVRAQSDTDIEVVTADNIEKLCERQFQSGTFLVLDSQTEEDLKKIAVVLGKSELTSTMAGCAGFAGFLPEIAGIKITKPEKVDFGHGVLAVCGSINEVSLEQMKYAEGCGYPVITLDTEAILNTGYFETESGKRLIEKIVSRLDTFGRLVLRTAGSREEADRCICLAAAYNIPADRLYSTIASNVGQLVKRVLDKTSTGTLVVFGGDTAMGIMNALGCRVLMPKDEIMPGVAVSEIPGFKDKMKLVSKAGGFGSREAMVEIGAYIERSK
jgi:uncharacterized protein YgbK (DUF1537 family)